MPYPKTTHSDPAAFLGKQNLMGMGGAHHYNAGNQGAAAAVVGDSGSSNVNNAFGAVNN